jgi:Rha family phage regulatory protein
LVRNPDKEQKPVTTSLKVAQYFGKQHKDVLKAIDNMECSSDFKERNFAPVEIISKNAIGGPIRSRHYELNRDGFMFTVMGFTGKKAARIKESFIEAFNMMEDRLRANPIMLLPDSEKIRLLSQGLQQANEKVEVLTEQVTEMAPKAEAHDEAMDLGENMTMTTAAKILGIGPKAIGPLLAHPRLHPGDPQDSWVPD